MNPHAKIAEFRRLRRVHLFAGVALCAVTAALSAAVTQESGTDSQPTPGEAELRPASQPSVGEAELSPTGVSQASAGEGELSPASQPSAGEAELGPPDEPQASAGEGDLPPASQPSAEQAEPDPTRVTPPAEGEAERSTASEAAASAPAGAAQARPATASRPVTPVLALKPAPQDVQITVTQAQTHGQLITVSVNQGVLVDFSVPVTEVRVANPEIADVVVTSPKQLLVNGKSFGTTQLIAVVNGGVQRIFTIAVDVDLERLQASIRATVPRAKVTAKALLDRVVVAGTVPDTESAERIMQIAHVYSGQVINHMRVAGAQQVLLRCTVAEVNRTATRQLGFNGWIAGENVQDMFGVNQLSGINPVNIGAAGSANVRGSIPFVTDQNGLPLTATPTLSLGFPRVQMQVFIQALRENGLLKVLAEPNLVTISGQEANFLAGGELPYPVAQGGTSNAISVEYRAYGVRLTFTPTVLGPGGIRLRVAPEVSEPDFSTAVTLSGFVVPGLIQRRVETVVELGPGQTFAIGGLLSETARAVSRKVPALGDVPILGALFSSVQYQSSESELVVLVTPELVEPLTPDQVSYLPGAEHIPPNDWELFCLGQVDGQGSPGRAKAAGAASPGTATSRPAGMRVRGPVGPAGVEEGT